MCLWGVYVFDGPIIIEKMDGWIKKILSTEKCTKREI
jgi:hypothetical protein